MIWPCSIGWRKTLSANCGTESGRQFSRTPNNTHDWLPKSIVYSQHWSRLSNSVQSVGQPIGPRPSDLPDRIGEYRILPSFGEGGMGVVYEAIQESLGRHVAFKVLPAPARLSNRFRERFRREARAAAHLLHHPHIVPVFGVGEDARHCSTPCNTSPAVDWIRPFRCEWPHRVKAKKLSLWRENAVQACHLLRRNQRRRK